MNSRQFLAVGLAGLASYGLASNTEAALSLAYQFNGKGNWSIDAVGSNNTPVGSISAEVPVGSTVVRAFLYSSQYAFSDTTVVPTVSFAGNVISGAAWTALGDFNPVGPGFALGGYRADVTGIVSGLVGAGSAVPFSFDVDSEDPNESIDGEVLAIVYSNPAESERTIAFLDGFSTSLGDSTSVDLADPLTSDQLTDPDFEVQLSLGIGFGFQPSSQFSTVDINGTRLTSSAGSFDDGEAANGALITAGGLGDSLGNPADPNDNASPDDELYSLLPFLAAGDTQIVIETENPSLDDNIFFAGINITAEADVRPPGVPEHGGTFALLGLALLGLAKARRHAAK
ncbi:MAG: PEP-CTERM sorting domain-containing protein [Verrucomicrobiales bacterium]